MKELLLSGKAAAPECQNRGYSQQQSGGWEETKGLEEVPMSPTPNREWRSPESMGPQDPGAREGLSVGPKDPGAQRGRVCGVNISER